MIIVDRLLERRHEAGEPIRVGLIGAGFMGRAVVRQILGWVRGMTVAVVCNRRLAGAVRAYEEAGVAAPRRVESEPELERCLEEGRAAVTKDPSLVCRAPGVEVVIEVTGTIEYAARAALEAFRHGKHVVAMNAELGATLGPILQVHAAAGGVVFTDADGDQPAVTLNLHRFVRGIGMRPVLCGNIKGLLDPYRTPSTQRGFAETWGQDPRKVTSFADGTKIAFEQAVVANATGMRVGRRGMFGPCVPPGTRVEEAAAWYPLEALLEGEGLVDYVVGAAPGGGVFVLGTLEDEPQRRFLDLYKLGRGPLYCFYVPCHLCHMEVANSVARAALLADAAIAPRGAPVVEVVAIAKRDLAAGEVLDGIGGYHLYGVCENAEAARRERLLPIGLAEGCTLARPARRDDALLLDDVEPPPGRLCDRLWAEQAARWPAEAPVGAR